MLGKTEVGAEPLQEAMEDPSQHMCHQYAEHLYPGGSYRDSPTHSEPSSISLDLYQDGRKRKLLD